MTNDQMIEELVEYQFQNITLVEVVNIYIQLQRKFLKDHFTEEEIKLKYDMLFGDAEVVH
jgi:spermidine synthase